MPLFQSVVLKIKRDHKKAERERESYLDLVDKLCHDSRRKLPSGKIMASVLPIKESTKHCI